jgi:hypothetical protein
MKDKTSSGSPERILERIMRVIPGYSGYKNKEHIRETDKQLREYLAQELDRYRKNLETAMKDLTRSKSFDLVGSLDSEVKRMQKYADSIRYASYGYSGLFSEIKIRENELQELHAHDLKFIDSLSEIKNATKTLADSKSDPALLKSSLDQLALLLDALDEDIQKRKDLFI